MNIEASAWLMACAVTLIAALLQGTVGFGYAVLAVPALSLVDPRLAPVPQILTALPLSVWAFAREWRAVDWRGAVWVLSGRVPGALLGALLLMASTQRSLDILIGASVLAAVALLSTELRLKRSPWVDFAAGTFGSVSGYVSGISGPPIALLFRDASGPALRATLGLIFTVGIVITLGLRASTGHVSVQDGWVAAVLLVPMLLGMWLSRRLHGLIEGRILRRALLLTSALAAFGLLGRALLGGP
ncbi:MAG TPA: sulfite exporter TauE/SafE family protein [Polyangiaceae bacterium]|nr:sulfite exporter TauE/SafE family protein [Polyangiaceae bacterium]